MTTSIHRASTDAQIGDCFAVMSGLRPHLVEAVAGYRVIEMLRTGRMLEIDDLVTAAATRSGGFGKALLDWIINEARSQGCSVVELDSAVHRADAHRFYFRQKMHVLGFHFSTSLNKA